MIGCIKILLLPGGISAGIRRRSACMCINNKKKPTSSITTSSPWPNPSVRRSSSSSNSNHADGGRNNTSSLIDKFWRWTSQSRPDWKSNPVEGAVAVIIFGVTGTTAVSMIRPTINSALGIEGSLVDGPNSYRVFSLLFLSPFYALTLFVVGTAFGRHAYFASMAKKILGRFLPSKIKEKIKCTRYPNITTKHPP